jgi:predicted ATPase
MKPGQVLEGRFRIEAEAEAGGMGQLYRARDLSTDEVVAVKVLLETSQAAAERFEREASTLASLVHPGIVRYIAHSATPEGRPFLVMEWLEGEDLARLLKRRKLTVEETLSLGARLASALGAAHGLGIVHRDLKPANIVLVNGQLDSPKLVDFGIAFLDGQSRVTATDTVIGTPSYMAPEQTRTRSAIDAAADVFSLGCVLFESLTGEPPFKADHVLAVLAKIIFEDAPRVSELEVAVPAWLDDLIARMLEKAPGARPRDGAEVVSLMAAGAASGSSDIGQVWRSLGRGERRFLGIVLAGKPDVRATDATLPVTVESSLRASLREAIERFGAHLELFANGTAVVVLDSTSVPTDIAVQAARCSLALRGVRADVPIAVTTGWGELGRGLPVGEAIDRAVSSLDLIDSDKAPGILIDETTAGLLDARFDVVDRAGAGFELRGERPALAVWRPLLGKSTPCVGRDPELALLEQTFASAVDEPSASVVMVSGPAGIGKSRIVHELIERRRRSPDPIEIWIGQGDLSREGSTFGLLADLLQRAAGITGGEPLPERRDRLAAFVAREVPERDRQRVTEFLGELAHIPFPDEDRLPLRAARQDSELCGEQMQRAFRDLLRSCSAARPVLLVLEDVHWGDRASVMTIGEALRELSGEPILVLATARPEVEELFPKLWVDLGRQDIRLRPLSPKASTRLARYALGEDADAAPVKRLVELSEGHPFFLEELVRAASEGEVEALPSTVVAMIQARLERLEPAARRALRAASILGDVFWPGAIAHMLSERPDPERWTSLVKKEICLRHRESRFPGEEEYAFRQALLREGAYALLTEDDRAVGHRLAGEWLERAGEANPLILANHFERGGAPHRAAELYVLGAEDASARRNYLDAERYYGRAEELAAGLPVAARRGRGLARFRLGRHADAVIELEGARGQAEAEGQTLAAVELLLDEAMVLDWMHEHPRAEERVLAAKALQVEGVSPLIDARLLLGLGRSAFRANRAEEAAGLLARAASSASRLGDEGYETQVIARLLLGFLLPQLGRLDEASAALDEVIPRSEERSDLMHLGAALNARALVRAYRGDRMGMIADFERTIELGRDLGQPVMMIVGNYNLGECLYFMDDLEAAEPYVREAALLTKRPNAGVHPSVIDLLAARIHLYRGDEAAASSLAGSIRAAEVKAREDGRELLSLSEGVLCATIELVAADAPDAEWSALEERSAACSAGQEHIEVLEARALGALRRGRFAEAARQLEKARSVASSIPNVMAPRLEKALARALGALENPPR